MFDVPYVKVRLSMKNKKAAPPIQAKSSFVSNSIGDHKIPRHISISAYYIKQPDIPNNY
jgi:hypothetical protein